MGSNPVSRCPSKRRKFRHKKRHQKCWHTERWPCEDTEVGGHHQIKERGLRRNQLCQHLDLGLLISRTVRNKFLLFMSASLQYFVVIVLANEYNILLHIATSNSSVFFPYLYLICISFRAGVGGRGTLSPSLHRLRHSPPLTNVLT